MWSEWLLPVMVALGIACGLFPLFLLILRRPPQLAEDNEYTRAPVLGELTESYATHLPMSASGQSEVQKLLMGAGFYHKTALVEYRAVRTTLTLAPLFFTLAAALFVDPAYLRLVLLIGVIVTLLGFSLPRVYLAYRRRKRAREISRGLPLAMDLITLNLSAGQNILASLNQTAREMRFSNPVLSEELAIVAKQAEMHSLEVAAKQWADRVQVPEVSNLSMLLVQSEKLGTDTSATLTELSNNFRINARQRAETQANRTSFWMLFPSVFCFWTAAAIILIGPAYLEFFDYKQRVGPQIINQAKAGIERANQRTRPAFDPNNPMGTPNPTIP